jgi:hypothetical protein
MNLIEAFADYMDNELLTGTLGDDLFIGGAPIEAPDACWWLTMSGGSTNLSLETGEKVKDYQIDVFYRDIDEQAVYSNLQELEEDINSDRCTQLTGYETIDMEATLFSVDQDIDQEDRKVGLLTITIRIYKE